MRSYETHDVTFWIYFLLAIVVAPALYVLRLCLRRVYGAFEFFVALLILYYALSGSPEQAMLANQPAHIQRLFFPAWGGVLAAIYLMVEGLEHLVHGDEG